MSQNRCREHHPCFSEMQWCIRVDNAAKRVSHLSSYIMHVYMCFPMGARTNIVRVITSRGSGSESESGQQSLREWVTDLQHVMCTHVLCSAGQHAHHVSPCIAMAHHGAPLFRASGGGGHRDRGVHASSPWSTTGHRAGKVAAGATMTAGNLDHDPTVLLRPVQLCLQH